MALWLKRNSKTINKALLALVYIVVAIELGELLYLQYLIYIDQLINPLKYTVTYFATGDAYGNTSAMLLNKVNQYSTALVACYVVFVGWLLNKKKVAKISRSIKEFIENRKNDNTH